MASQIALSIDDKDLDDAALWAVIDSAAASHSSKSRKPLYLKHTPTSITNVPPQSRSSKTSRQPLSPPEGEVLHEPWLNQPTKIARFNVSEVSERSPLAMVKRVPRTPITPVYSSPQSYSSPDSGWFSEMEYGSGTKSEAVNLRQREEEEDVRMRHSLSGRFPTVPLFKEYQNAAMAILEKSDYTMISGHPFIKKSGWRKISFYFNLSFEIKDKTIEFDENRNVQRAEFVVRAHMHGGRFSDGWGSSDRREKKFNKPNHDIPSTAETRAKNKACQDLLGIGEYHPGESHFQ